MFYKLKKGAISTLLLVLIAMGITVSVCFADQNNSIPKIKGIPTMGSSGDRDFMGEVEQYYDFTGTVDQVQDEGIIVDDSFFKKAPNATISGGSAGNRVGLMLNREGEFVLCEPVKEIIR